MVDDPHAGAGPAGPPWSQGELLRLMDVQSCGAGHYVAPAHGPTVRNVVEAGQMLGDAIVAAAKEVPRQRVVSASMIFTRVAAHDAPLDVDVEVLHSGRTYSTAQVRIRQHDTLRCAGTVLLDAGAPDLIRSAAPMPRVEPPEKLASLDIPGTEVDGRDMRVAGDGYSPDPGHVGPPELFVWTRYRDAPEAGHLHAALLAQSCAHWTVAAALRPHPGFGESMAHSAISTGITMATITFHDDADVTQWLLYSTRVVYAGRGHAQSEGRVHAADGRLMASYSVHAMVRAFRSADTAARTRAGTVL
ncbi:Acyl-CoA thioesterase 2 [Nocardia cerradoensis]|uniref:Acyl-CoA thioesterase 2 n=1 Tax=Nocardia cerradoensis TaxID=85688 RepID=A0A231H043_9NOCA|nr:acyl-CoA thioesterase domain-containing protein [Nocardia cerradoensis]OXR42225.1 Acyl-CoA thioesterase 2 [Nocardia cerradoensis]